MCLVLASIIIFTPVQDELLLGEQQVSTPPVVGITSDLIERYHVNLVKVYHLPQLFRASAVERELRPLFPRSVARTIIMEYYAQIVAGSVNFDQLVAMSGPGTIHRPEATKLFFLHLGYISLKFSSPRFNGVVLTPDIAARLRRAVLPVNCIFQASSELRLSLQSSSGLQMVPGWSPEKDWLLMTEAMENNFCWKSILNNEVNQRQKLKL